MVTREEEIQMVMITRIADHIIERYGVQEELAAQITIDVYEAMMSMFFEVIQTGGLKQ